MNSTMSTAVYETFLKALDKPTRARLFQQAIFYYEAGRQGNPEKLRSAYQALLATVQSGEQATGIQLITSPDGSFLCALNAVAAKTYETMSKEYVISFDSLQQANTWLADKQTLILTSVKIQTQTSFGLFANHSNASKIVIRFRMALDNQRYIYGIFEQELTNMFVKGKDDNSFAKKWEAANPGLECVFLQQASNSRASGGSIMFGFGLDYVEHVKYFVTYRKRLPSA